jgi:hypothetical protein
MDDLFDNIFDHRFSDFCNISGFDPEMKSMAVIACGENSSSVLHWIGHDLYFEITEAGLYTPEDLGIDYDPGIWIWEGRYYFTKDYWSEDCQSDPVGKHRVPTDEEWNLIKQNKPPWNIKDWKCLNLVFDFKGNDKNSKS